MPAAAARRPRRGVHRPAEAAGVHQPLLAVQQRRRQRLHQPGRCRGRGALPPLGQGFVHAYDCRPGMSAHLAGSANLLVCPHACPAWVLNFPSAPCSHGIEPWWECAVLCAQCIVQPAPAAHMRDQDKDYSLPPRACTCATIAQVPLQESTAFSSRFACCLIRPSASTTTPASSAPARAALTSLLPA